MMRRSTDAVSMEPDGAIRMALNWPSSSTSPEAFLTRAVASSTASHELVAYELTTIAINEAIFTRLKPRANEAVLELLVSRLGLGSGTPVQLTQRVVAAVAFCPALSTARANLGTDTPLNRDAFIAALSPILHLLQEMADPASPQRFLPVWSAPPTEDGAWHASRGVAPRPTAGGVARVATPPPLREHTSEFLRLATPRLSAPSTAPVPLQHARPARPERPTQSRPTRAPDAPPPAGSAALEAVIVGVLERYGLHVGGASGAGGPINPPSSGHPPGARRSLPVTHPDQASQSDSELEDDPLPPPMDPASESAPLYPLTMADIPRLNPTDPDTWWDRAVVSPPPVQAAILGLCHSRWGAGIPAATPHASEKFILGLLEQLLCVDVPLSDVVGRLVARLEGHRHYRAKAQALGLAAMEISMGLAVTRSPLERAVFEGARASQRTASFTARPPRSFHPASQSSSGPSHPSSGNRRPGRHSSQGGGPSSGPARGPPA